MRTKTLPALMVAAQVILGHFCMTLPAFAEEGTTHDQHAHHEESMEQVMTPLQPISLTECDGCIVIQPKHESVGIESATPCHEGHCLSAGYSLATNLAPKLQDGERVAWSAGIPLEPSNAQIQPFVAVTPPQIDQSLVALQVRRE